MKAHSRGKNYFKRSVAQSVSRNLSFDRSRGGQGKQEKSLQMGKYRILLDEVLGKGYSCKVYKGVEEGKELKRYAIKVIELCHFSSSCLRLFEREIDIHRQLSHDNIVRCYDVMRTSTHIYLVMEYCPHGDLASYIQQRKKPAESAVVDIMTQVIQGYKHLVKEGILHRDLKPANILRSGRHWKISDFGFSVRSGTFVDEINVGTPLYMPLESLSRSYYSVKTDIFALGVILFELLHGRTPWECDSEVDLVRKLTNGQELTIEKPIANPKIREFILRSCHLNEHKRLSKQELQTFDFTDLTTSRKVDAPFPSSSSPPSSPSPPSSSSSSSSSPPSSPSPACSPSTPSTSSPSSREKEDYVIKNDDILEGYLRHCRFLSSVIEHVDCFLLGASQKSTLLMVLLKYLLKLGKMLEEGRFNSMRLVRFDEYKAKDHYSLIHREIEESSAKYEKVYLDYIKHADVKVIREVNQRFREFTMGSHPLGPDFYAKLGEYFQQTTKTSSEAVAKIVNDSREEQVLNEKLEALRNALLLCQYVAQKGRGEAVNFCSGWLADYSQSKLQKVDYLAIRKQVRAL